ncbi:ABC transporter ATP-binding protein [Salinirubellus salinus]|jgi:spermidine/putrescine transport system ATP-binding protein|uniref:Molybdate/tungstate import ATP-binding protein WtpC n=1 Tax=Salinirubellus salinus TaxID=1364945 RepID=A0A9E7UCS3_9EURY|nr:ABC transporter ATP-binding protein [Salinirubellus salinus]UWM56582.1 ABC transporter ATP-binding protein [Salinirubellus salinus]
MAMLELDGLTVSYGDLTAVDGVSLRVAEGELCCLLGPSGSGKSTVLRAISGFETPTGGRVLLDGVDVTDLPPNERDTSMVFQDWALFPQQSVQENVEFGLRVAGVDAAEREARARETLELVEMDGYEDSRPGQLSGGQKQRVALARSLVVDPDLLLLDEPLSSLDRRLRETMQLELKRIHDRVGTTMLYVTHDQDEAFTLGDRLGVMDGGELVQVDTPETVYDDPTDRFVESFLGTTNFVECTVTDGRAPTLSTPFGVAFDAPVDGSGLEPDDAVTVSLRPERLAFAPAAEAEREMTPQTAGDGGESAVSVVATVEETVYRGADLRVRLSAGDADLFVEPSVASAPNVEPGDRLAVRFTPSDALYFDASGARCR